MINSRLQVCAAKRSTGVTIWRPRLGPDVVEVGKIGFVQSAQHGFQAFAQVVFFQKEAVCFGGDGKTVGHEDAFWGKLRKHFPQRGVFAAHLVQIGHAELVKPEDLGGHQRLLEGGPETPSLRDPAQRHIDKVLR